MEKIFEIATNISTPLGLAGLFAAIFFYIARQLISARLFPKLTRHLSSDIIKLIITYLFVLSLVAMVLGFGGYVISVLSGDPDQAIIDIPQEQRDRAVKIAAGATLQATSGDYSAAWNQMQEAVTIDQFYRNQQAKLGMAWLRNAGYFVGISKEQSFREIVDKVVPVLYEILDTAKPVEAADIYAHAGYGNYLKRLDGIHNLEISKFFYDALQIDPVNTYAHAMLGFWMICRERGATSEGRSSVTMAMNEFSAALMSNRDRSYVRKMQLAALQSMDDSDYVITLIKVLNDMRKNNEPLEPETRARLSSRIYSWSDVIVLKSIPSAIPPSEHLVTYLWLLQNKDKSLSESVIRGFFFARLTEAVGDSARALALYRSFDLDKTSYKYAAWIKEGIARITHK